MQDTKNQPAEGSARNHIFKVMASCAEIVKTSGQPVEVKLGDVKTRDGNLIQRASVAMNVNQLQLAFPTVRFYVTAKKSHGGIIHIGCRPC